MNKRQEKFCRVYLTSLNVAEAAKQAGYNPTTGYKLMKQPEIKAYITRQLEELKNDQIAEVKELMEMLTAATRDVHAELKDRLKAAELLGRTYGIFKPKEEKQQQNQVIIITGENEIRD